MQNLTRLAHVPAHAAQATIVRSLLVLAAALALLLGIRTAAHGASASLRRAPSANVRARLTRPARIVLVAPADTQRAVLNVKGMFCASCERTITVMLQRTPGVVGATVSVARRQAVVLYDPARTTAAKLVSVIERLGYKATLQKP